MHEPHPLKLGGIREIDEYHYDTREWSELDFYGRMHAIATNALQNLKQAYEDGISHVMFRHGHSTSRLGATSARSMIRGVIRDKAATPYILRSKCIQHNSVFIAAIRPK